MTPIIQPDNKILLRARVNPQYFSYAYPVFRFTRAEYVTEPNTFTYVTEMKIMRGKSKPG